MSQQKLLRAPNAAAYLRENYGFGSERSLAKFRVFGGGPLYRKLGRFIVYTAADLDTWALSRLSGPMASTSDRPKVAA